MSKGCKTRCYLDCMTKLGSRGLAVYIRVLNSLLRDHKRPLPERPVFRVNPCILVIFSRRELGTACCLERPISQGKEYEHSLESDSGIHTGHEKTQFWRRE